MLTSSLNRLPKDSMRRNFQLLGAASSPVEPSFLTSVAKSTRTRNEDSTRANPRPEAETLFARNPKRRSLKSPPARDVKPHSPEPPHIEDRYTPSAPKEPKLGKFLLAGLSLVGVIGAGIHQPTPPPEIAMESVESIAPFAMSDISLSYEAASSEQIEEAANWALGRSYELTPEKNNENRHELRARVQSQDLMSETARNSDSVHYDGSDVVVIAFEGTGTFHPRKAAVMQGAAARLREQGLRVDGSQGSLSWKVTKSLSEREGQDVRWSGISSGPLESLIRHPELSANTQLLSFPSEELEVLSSFDAYETARWGEIIVDATKSYMGETPGIDGAIKSMNEILQQAKERGKNPRFVVISHSSGGRSLVKFLEKAKSLKDPDGNPVTFSALTIDPVKEAHEALVEAGSELLGQKVEEKFNDFLDFVGLPERELNPPLVKTRIQPESLYSPSNVDSFLNFFQRKDTQGVKVGPQVGIQGSPVVGAINREVTDVDTGGHGQIALNESVKDAFLNLVAGQQR